MLGGNRGYEVNRKRVLAADALMGIEAVYKTEAETAQERDIKIYPYLLRGWAGWNGPPGVEKDIRHPGWRRVSSPGGRSWIRSAGSCCVGPLSLAPGDRLLHRGG